jgi:hypothetical protein|nr:MAG TPA: hypothetical protein [Caudoviricetes sp.]
MAQKLSFSNIAVPDQKTIEQAAFQGYTGPTPPPGKYRAKLAGVQIQARDTGNVFVVRYVINETGELKKYNGCAIFDRLTLPEQQKDGEYYTIRLRSFNDFCQAASEGKGTLRDFTKALADGKYKVEEGKQDGVFKLLVVAGKLFNFNKEHDVFIELRHSPNANDVNNPYLNVRYIVMADTARLWAAAEDDVVDITDVTEEIDDDEVDGLDEDDDDDFDDLDDLD